ncbi:MAG: lytic transglycosylase domain-containing protein [Fibrobacteria bacterium]|nr:lytic transglycosylase domain-containing protein [Fibrobacteria bacterium]
MAAGKSLNGIAGLIYKQLKSKANEENNNPIPHAPNFQFSPGTIPPAVPGMYPSQKSGYSQFNLNSIIKSASDKHDIDERLIKSIILQESAGNPKAVSTAGAKGLMQLMDTTAKEMGVRNVFDPRENVLGGVKYFKMLQKMFKGDLEKSLAAYNAGPGQVKKYKGIPPFPETRNYVKRVMRLYEEFKQISEGD